MRSANGVFINDRRISEETDLENGDFIEIGNSRLLFTTEDFPDRESAMAHFHKQGERRRSTLMR